ncbi:MAG: hypothetical protein H8E44_06965 [Planctomycetes bacterium]|nr:hypothetical protein [Planctomycetota bacterium]
MRLAKAAILLMCMQLLLADAARAGSGGVINLPMGVKPKNGLRLDIDTRWIDANGYRPVRVTATNLFAGPNSPDRSIRVELSPRSWRWGDTAPSVSFFIEIPETVRQVEQTVSIPQSDQWGAIRVEVYEDGEELKDLTAEASLSGRNQWNWWSWSEATPAILIVDSDAPPDAERRRRMSMPQLSSPESLGVSDVNHLPDIRCLAALYPDPNNNNDLSFLQLKSETTDEFTLQTIDRIAKVEMLPPGELPRKWIDYTCFDLIFVTFDDLKLLVNENPDRWQAIRDWVATGPTLCVYDMPLDSQHLLELEELLDLPPMPNSEDDTNEWRGWSLPNENNASEEIRELDGLYQTMQRNRGIDQSSLLDVLLAAGQSQITPKPDETPFVSRDVDLGRVFALRTNEPFSPGSYGITWLLNEIGNGNWMWYRRHGMSLHRENSDYWNLMIPGVGRAPVNSYLVLISLFVVVIGPVNYFLLRKKKRLYLLLVTVPIGAGLITFSLLNYALITDGLGVRARLRSYAQIDQTTGRAVSWSRQNYYAGLSPSSGLRFPPDAAFYTVEHHPAERRHRRNSNRWLVWDEDQRLTSGYLGARSTAQFMVVQSHKSRRGLSILEPDGQETAPRVTNNLEADIAKLVICDSAGQYYWAENIETGKRVQPQQIEPSEAAKRLRVAYDVNRPAVPEGFDPRYYRSSFGFGRMWWTDVDQSLRPPGFDQGVLERNVQNAIYTDVKNMKPRTYVAITRTSAESPLGYQASQEEASFHVVSGRW